MYNGRYRAFIEEYRDEMERRGGWPRDKILTAWFKKACGYSGGQYTAMKKGDLVPDKYPYWFIEFLVQHAERLEARQAVLVTTEFLARFGIAEINKNAIPAVLGHLCTVPVDAPEGLDGAIDYLRHSIDILRLFQHIARFDSYIRGCPVENLPAAIEWMYIRVAQQTAANGPSMVYPEAIKYAEKHMDIEIDDYLENARAWAEYNPWTIVRAWQKRGSVGMSTVLPVTADFYEEVKAGAKVPYQCKRADLIAPSLNLILEAAVEQPEALGVSGINPTRSLLACLIFQICALSRCNRIKSPDTLRVLTFAGTPKNRERLLGSGFLPLGRHMTRTHLELFERRFDAGHLATKDIMNVMALHSIGALCPSAPKMEDD